MNQMDREKKREREHVDGGWMMKLIFLINLNHSFLFEPISM
jgi:hypothetical protein